MIEQRKHGWWMWDETGAYALGPFSTEEAAKAEQDLYGEYLDTGKRNSSVPLPQGITWVNSDELAEMEATS